jgi:Tol biopolymer transport system component
VVVLAATGLATAYFRAAPSSTPAVLRFVVTPPEGTTFSPSASFLAVSPNGRFLAFLASRPGEERRLWVRALDSLTARELAGTDGALGPFWSPDSRYLGFFARNRLKTVSLLGEPPEVLCETPSLEAASGTWHRNGAILFAQSHGIYRTSSTGGGATPVTSVDRQRGESAHVLPQFLPDGRHFVYTARAEAGGSFESWIVLRSLDSPDERRLFIARSQALYADRDYLLFLRDGALLAQPFDLARLQLRGEPLPVPQTEHVGFNPATPRGMFSVSQNGVLAYRPSAMAELGWFDRSGGPLGSIGAAGFDRNPALSHDGQRLAVSRYDPPMATRSVWILDVRRGGVASRFTARTAWETCPVWSPDDTSIIFARGVPSDEELYEKSSNRATEERVLPYRPRGCPLDWSPDGRYLLYGTSRGFGSPGSGLWLVPVKGDGEPKALAGEWPSGPQTPQARISPDGRWLTYVSDATGRREIYVRSFPDGKDGTWQVSSQGGIEPQWRGDGRELFFLGADQKLMSVPVITGSAFRAGTPTALFSTDLDPTGLPISGRNQYLVTADGQRFLINQPRRDAGASSPVALLVNWTAALKK